MHPQEDPQSVGTQRHACHQPCPGHVPACNGSVGLPILRFQGSASSRLAPSVAPRQSIEKSQGLQDRDYGYPNLHFEYHGKRSSDSHPTKRTDSADSSTVLLRCYPCWDLHRMPCKYPAMLANLGIHFGRAIPPGCDWPLAVEADTNACVRACGCVRVAVWLCVCVSVFACNVGYLAIEKMMKGAQMHQPAKSIDNAHVAVFSVNITLFSCILITHTRHALQSYSVLAFAGDCLYHA